MAPTGPRPWVARGRSHEFEHNGWIVTQEKVGLRDRIRLALRLTTVDRLRDDFKLVAQLRDNERRIDRLARYNAEVSRGLAHTPGYAAEMAREQEAFNRGELL